MYLFKGVTLSISHIHILSPPLSLSVYIYIYIYIYRYVNTQTNTQIYIYIYIYIYIKLSLIGIILRWGFLIWELIFIYCGFFVLILVVFCVVSSFITFRPNFTSGLLQVILPRPRIGMMNLVTVSPVITDFHSCCLSHHVFDQVNLWPAWVGFETVIFWQCSPGTVETQRLNATGPEGRSRMDFLVLQILIWSSILFTNPSARARYNTRSIFLSGSVPKFCNCL